MRFQPKDKSKILVSAPGKIMILGEHAVVYGYPCLVTAVDKRIYIEASKIKGKKDIIIAPQVKESRFVEESINFFKERFKVNKSVRIKTFGDFSHRVGLGSSSAVTVAAFKALSVLFDKKLTLKEIFDLSYQVSLSIQKVGSGFDIAAATYGKTTYFVFGGKVINSFEVGNLPLVVGYSGIKADTPKLIKKVSRAYLVKGEQIKEIFKEINQLVERAKTCMSSKNYKELGLLMNKNHQLLKELKVSTVKLDDMIEAALKAGAWGAKLSGAGGGDCMIALVSEDKKRLVEAAIKKQGGEIINVNNNSEGVRQEYVNESNSDSTS